MKLNVFCKKIEKHFPLSLQTKDDNSGRFMGDDNRNIKTALICLDVNSEVITMAITNACDIIVSHHPFAFDDYAKVIKDDPIKRDQLNRLRKTNIAIYSAHTSCDAAKVGMNEWLAERLSLTKVKKLNDTGIGVIGELIVAKEMDSCIDTFQKIFGEKTIRTGFIDEERKVKRVAVVGGSGGDFTIDAIKNDCDILVTSDIKWHQWQFANDQKITIIDVGHYMEQVFVPRVAELLKKMKIEVIEHDPENLMQYREIKTKSSLKRTKKA